jgi:hypothetical protein
MARKHKKKLIFEEFGTTSPDKSSFIKQALTISNNLGIPSMIWQAMPAKKGDYEFWIDDTESWKELSSAAADALNITSDLSP